MGKRQITERQDILSLLMKSVMAGQETAEGKLMQVQDITDQILKSQGDLFAGMSILGELRDELGRIGLDEQAQKEFAEHFVDWFRNIHDDDIARIEQLRGSISAILGEQNEIHEKIQTLTAAADQTQEAINEFRSQWEASEVEELRQLYRQAQNYQFDRAYDKAYEKYEQIVTRGGGDPAVLWHMILCHYCISYQENDEGVMVPTILNPDLSDPDEMSLRLDFESMLTDPSMVTGEQAEIFRHELDKIDTILDEYRHIKHEMDYDIFISVKQDEDGRYTYDSNVAADLYYFLQSKGYKVFNSRISKIPVGEEYEPYIISALLTARVMIVVGTCAENMNAAWVKNEWSRFQWIQQSEKRNKGETDRLLLCYLAQGMKPKELPRALNPGRQAIIEGVESGDILTATLEEVFRKKGFRQKALRPNKKPPKAEAEIKKTPLKTDKSTDHAKEREHTEEVTTTGSRKWIIGIAAAAIVIICFAVSRMGSGVHQAEPETTLAESAPVIETELMEEVTETETDYAIDWKDDSLEAAMREITGITDREIMYSDVKDIRELDVSGRKDITDISSLSVMTKLESLDLRLNQIEDISSLKSLTKLEELDLASNKISDLSALAALENLTELNLYSNEITDLSGLEGLDKLQILDLSDNSISDISKLAGLTNLTELTLYENQIEDIRALKDLTHLTKLDLLLNKVTDISALADLTDLEFLMLHHNKITDIGVLSNLKKLRTLSLSYNQIEDISSLADLTDLESLEIEHNKISDISSLTGLTKLKDLSLGSNDISDYTPIEELDLENLWGVE